MFWLTWFLDENGSGWPDDTLFTVADAGLILRGAWINVLLLDPVVRGLAVDLRTCAVCSTVHGSI